MSSHWKLANTPCAALTREEMSLAVAELQLASLPSSLDPRLSLHDMRLAAVHTALARLQVPLCRTARKMVGECVRQLDRQSMKPGDPVIPNQEFLRLLSQLKSIYSMWRSTVLRRSAGLRRSLGTPNGGQMFFADDLAEALDQFCESTGGTTTGGGDQRMVSLPMVESVVNDVFGQEVIQPTSDPSSPASPSEAYFGTTHRPAVGLVGMATLCRALLNGDFVTDLESAASFVGDETGGVGDDEHLKSGASRTTMPLVDECIDLVDLRRKASLAMNHSSPFSSSVPSSLPQPSAGSRNVSPQPPADLKPLAISSHQQLQDQTHGQGHHLQDTLLLAMSIDVPKCPKNLRAHPEDSDSDEMASARKSSRRLSKGKLSGRFRLAAHQALHMARSGSITAASTPPTSAKSPVPASGHTSLPPPSPVPARPQSRGPSAAISSASMQPKPRAGSLTHKRSVTPAAGLLLPSLADHTALSNPMYERYKRTFPKKIVQFR